MVPAAKPPMTPAATSPPPARTGVLATLEKASDATTAGTIDNLFISDPEYPRAHRKPNF